MKYLVTLSFLFCSFALLAQPSYDDCAGIVDLGVAPVCPGNVFYNNVGATESNIGSDNFPGCFVGNPERDVWLMFIATDTILDYRITVTGMFDSMLNIPSIINPQIAIYRGDCEFDGLQLLDCVTAASNETEVFIDLQGLTPGLPYFLRINDWSSSGTPNAGAFKLCIDKKPPITTIDQGTSNLCSGTLCDSGGPDEDYDNNENHVFTICPTAPHNCINFSLQYYNIEYATDQLIFYDGPNTNSPVIANINGSAAFAFLLNPNVTNAGGACYSVSASSGCLTIEFTSDATATYEGFCGTWECTAEECQPSALIDVNTSATPQEIVESVVAGQTNVTITNIDCPNASMGTFESPDNSDLGLEKGLLLTSGSAANVANPGNFFSSLGNGNPGDPDLDYLSTVNGNGLLSNDACVVELEVFAATDEITFEYVFGSEEYPEYAYTSFNDIFAFLVSGPGIVGDPNIADQLNIATLPDGTFVQINSLNYQDNWQYYRDNSEGMSVVYDGLTTDSAGVKKSLTARVPTIPCNTYKLKLAIADRGDSAFDSGVFISEIKGGSPNLGVNYFSGIDYLVEECTVIPDEISVSLNNPVPVGTTFNVVVGGTATLGVDYTLTIPSTLTFNTGTEVFTFPIKPITDGLPEGTETIEIKLTRDFGCGEAVLAILTIEIRDNLQVGIFGDQFDTVFVCQGSCAQLIAKGAQNFFWQPPGLFSDPNISNPTICPDSNLWVTVTGTLGVCVDMDSAYLLLVNPMIDIVQGNQVTACPGDTITLFAQNNVNNSNLQWTGFIDPPLQDPNNPTQVLVPNPIFGFFFLNVSVELGGCIAEDFVSITVDNIAMPQIANDTIICENYSVDLGEDIPFTATQYSWTPNENLEPGPNVSGPVATPEETTTYTLIATGPQGLCKDTASVTVTVLPADVGIQNADTVFICIGDTATLTSVSSTGGIGQSWFPQDYLTQVTPEVVKVSPPVSTWYYSSLVVGACMVVDSVLVYVDSLPALPIMADPAKPSYCQGEEIKLISPTYEPASFPGIDLEWINPIPGSQTPDSFLNMVIIALEDHTYLRTVTVHGCTRTDSLFINVVPVASMSVQPAIDTICPGESVQFSVTADPGVTDFSWTPATGLSCTDCENPLASPEGTTTYSVEGEFEGCPVGASATVVVQPGPAFAFPGDVNICPGESIQLNSANNPGVSYIWSSTDGTFSSVDENPIVTPSQTTTYNVVASNAACEREEEITIFVATDFTLSVMNDTTICAGQPIFLTASTNPAVASIVWTNVSGGVLDASVAQSLGGTSTLFVTATSGDGCFTHSDSVIVTVIPTIFVDTIQVTEVGQATPDTLYEGEQFVLSTNTVPYPVPGGVFEWFVSGELYATTNDTTSGTLTAPEVENDSVFTFSVRVTNDNGCSSLRDLPYVILNNPVAVPNIFTPNGDGVNDTFKPISLVPITVEEFKVWNRWGQLVYNNENGNNGWDGSHKGEDQALSDVYVYHIVWRISGSTGPSVTEKGDVTLVR